MLEKWYVWDKISVVRGVAGIIQCNKKIGLKGSAVLNPLNSNVKKTVTCYTLGEPVESKRGEK